MRPSAGNIPNLRTITSLRGDSLKIDLGKVFEGSLIAWMKKDNSEHNNFHRRFEIIDNQYLYIDKLSTLDHYVDGELFEAVQGRWHFEVKQTLNKGTDQEEQKTVYRGVIKFINNITGATSADYGNGGAALQLELQFPL